MLRILLSGFLDVNNLKQKSKYFSYLLDQKKINKFEKNDFIHIFLPKCTGNVSDSFKERIANSFNDLIKKEKESVSPIGRFILYLNRLINLLSDKLEQIVLDNLYEEKLSRSIFEKNDLEITVYIGCTSSFYKDNGPNNFKFDLLKVLQSIVNKNESLKKIKYLEFIITDLNFWKPTQEQINWFESQINKKGIVFEDKKPKEVEEIDILSPERLNALIDKRSKLIQERQKWELEYKNHKPTSIHDTELYRIKWNIDKINEDINKIDIYISDHTKH